jgi:hypothetical protein
MRKRERDKVDTGNPDHQLHSVLKVHSHDTIEAMMSRGAEGGTFGVVGGQTAELFEPVEAWAKRDRVDARGSDSFQEA